MKESEAYNSLISSFDSGRMAHAYIISGCGKDKAVNFVERMIGYILSSDDENKREHIFHQVHTRRALDAYWIEPENKSRSISIAQIRDLLDDLYKTSYNQGWKAAAFVDADRLGQGAGNAFLKTLEEPPDRCVFFLIVDNIRSLLPTIISRCQTVNIDADDNGDGNDALYEEAVSILMNNRPVVPAARLVSAMTVAKLFDDFFNRIKKEMIKEEAADGADTVDKNIIDARAEAMYKEKRNAIMKFLFSFYRDMYVLLADPHACIINKRFENEVRTYMEGRSAKSIMHDMSVLENINGMMEANVRPIQALRAGFSRMKL